MRDEYSERDHAFQRDRSIYQAGAGVYGSDYWRDFDGSGEGHDRLSYGFLDNGDHHEEHRHGHRRGPISRMLDKLDSFVGHGPKGWSRSDDRIYEDVCERLTEHPLIDASTIEVTVKDGEVVLAGTVADRRTKRLAEDEAERVRGVQDVHNQVRIRL